MMLRTAERSDVPALVTLWHEGWTDAHAGILPAELAPHRTPEHFRQRLDTECANVRVAATADRVLGFSLCKDDELNQLYVAAQARGMGIAASLLADAEERLATRGVRTAWLTCAIGMALLPFMGSGLGNILGNVSPFDPMIYSLVVGLMLAVAITATVTPTRRALMVDPAAALRYE
jgi:GNAT superfamily N-acetyltransferase